MHYIETMNIARQAYIQAESSERIKRALRHPVRVSDEVFSHKDKVYYKRDDSNRWRGPATVIGQDGKIVFVRHGSRLLRVALCRVIRVDKSNISGEMDIASDKGPTSETSTANLSNSNDHHDHSESDTDSEDLVFENDNVIANDNVIIKQEVDDSIIEQEVHPIIEGNHHISVSDEAVIPNQDTSIDFDNENQAVNGRPNRIRNPPPRYNPETGLWSKPSADSQCFDFEEVNAVMIPPNRHNEPEVLEAKNNELENWRIFEVMDEVKDLGQKTISTRWVISEKDNPDKSKNIKARLVIRGFEDDENLQVDSPTVSKATFRLGLALAANEGWVPETIDIKGAFLQGRLIGREVYVEPPSEIKRAGFIWRLRKTAYGLCDAAREWHMSLVKELISFGCKQSELDKAAFRYYDSSGALQGIVLIHVDDIMCAGGKEFESKVVQGIVTKFKVGKHQRSSFKYVGIEVDHQAEGIRISQRQYIDEICEIDFDNINRDKNDILSKHETRQLRALTGQILWASSQTRLDACFDALELSMERNRGTLETLKRANKVVRKLKHEHHSILYPKLGSAKDFEIYVYADASYANLPDQVSSAGGHLIVLKCKDNFKCSVIDWSSSKLKRVVDNTLASETISMKLAVESAIYIGHLLNEFCNDVFQNNPIPVFSFTDNRSLEEAARSTKQVAGKRLRIDLAEIKRMLDTGELNDMNWCESKEQLADGLTKKGVMMKNLLTVAEKGCLNII